MIAIVDYGLGNLQSVLNAFAAVGAEACVTAEGARLRAADAIVLPGVGAFGDGMANLRARGLVDVLEEEVLQKGKPFLGLCLGLQLLATVGYEHGEHRGLGWIPGQVERIPIPEHEPEVRVPHIGWNEVTPTPPSALYAGIEGTPSFYFVHSYVLRPKDPDVVSATCVHGTEFVASIERENVYATQFHPERSHRAGLTLLRNFATLTSSVAT